jgi:ribosomal protein S18 acetylase RimI-like enzyme
MRLATMTLQIRHAQPEDYDRVIDHVDDWWGGRAASGILQRLFFVHFGPTSFVAEDDDGIAGFLCGFLSQAYPDEAYIHVVGVRPDLRGSGLGRTYERFFDTVVDDGRSVVRCVTSPLNEGSIAFHARMGFASRLEPRYDGEGRDRIVFEKRLR